MVLVRDNDNQTWTKRELLADMSQFNIKYPFVCRDDENLVSTESFVCMKELPTEITKAEAEKTLSELKGIEIKIK